MLSSVNYQLSIINCQLSIEEFMNELHLPVISTGVPFSSPYFNKSRSAASIWGNLNS